MKVKVVVNTREAMTSVIVPKQNTMKSNNKYNQWDVRNVVVGLYSGYIDVNCEFEHFKVFLEGQRYNKKLVIELRREDHILTGLQFVSKTLQLA